MFVCVFVCVHVRMCLRVSLAATVHVHVCWILLMREGLVPSCVCVCSSGNDWLSYLKINGKS